MPRRIFVAGTGRSGTTVTARLLGAHPDLTLIPYEVRFLAASGGLADLLAGKTELRAFCRSFQRVWFHGTERGVGGLRRLVDEERFETALRRFRRSFAADPGAASRRLTATLLDPLAGEATGWVEHTPETALVSSTVHRLFPGARLVQVVRDGRDVGSSVAARDWGPGDVVEAVRWWGWRMVRAAAEAKDLPPGRHRVIRFEDLVARRREAAYHDLLDAAGIADHAAVREFFDREVRPEAAHGGRWRDEIRAPEIDLAYRAARTRLRAVPGGESLDTVLGADAGPEAAAPDLAAALAEQAAYEEREEALLAERAQERRARGDAGGTPPPTSP